MILALTLTSILKAGAIAFWLGLATAVLIGLWHSFYTSESNDNQDQ